MRNNSNDSIEAVYLRLKAYLNKLEGIISEIVDELECNRKERNDWFEWHEDWKNAWLCDSDKKNPLSDEFENLRFITSIRRRNSIYGLKKEITELKNELELIREDREKLLSFLNNSVFQN